LSRILFWLRTHKRGVASWLAFVPAVIALVFIAATLGREDTRALISAMLALLAVIVLFLMARSPVTLVRERAPEPAPVTTLSPQLIINEVRTAALVSFGQIGQVNVRKERRKPAGDFKELLDPFVGEELVMDVGVRVVAGVNLKHLREEDVRVSTDGRGLEITLPPSKVMMVYVDENLTNVVSHKKGWLTRRDISMLDAARREAMESMVRAALDKGLLQKAGEQAALTVQGIASRLGAERVSVVPTLPPDGAHYEELQDPGDIAKIKALPPPDAVTGE
jgi:hypothetical protein